MTAIKMSTRLGSNDRLASPTAKLTDGSARTKPAITDPLNAATPHPSASIWAHTQSNQTAASS